MPEAPWIRRCQHGIKFTDNMQEEDVDLNTDENEKQVKVIQQQQNTLNVKPNVELQPYT